MTGDINTTTDGGTVSVTLNQNAVVNGTVDGGNATSSNSTLTFTMTTSSKSEYDNALATLVAGNAAAGSITINGETFTWTNFDDLVNSIAYLKSFSGGTATITATLQPNCFNDGRVNYRDCDASIAVYQTADALRLFAIHPATGAGTLVDVISLDKIRDAAVPESAPVLLFQAGHPFSGAAIQLWLKPDGRIQWQTSLRDGKPYVIEWDLASPQSYYRHPNG